MEICNVEDGFLVIKIPLETLKKVNDWDGYPVTSVEEFAPHVAREIGAEDMGERLYIETFLDAAMTRAAEADAPGIEWNDMLAEDRQIVEP